MQENSAISESAVPIELEADYYLHNFVQLVDYVFDLHKDLLNDAELEFRNRFHRLPAPAQKLYVRMLMRKGNLFRDRKLRYQEIGKTADAAQALLAANLIEINPALEPPVLAPLFSKSEWLEMLLNSDTKLPLPAPKPMSRAELDQHLQELHQQISLSSLVSEPIYQLTNPEIFNSYRLLYFGSLNRDLTEFVLRDLGLFRYENYRLDRDTRLFESREQLEKHLQFYQLRELFDLIPADDAEALYQFHAALPDATDDSLLDRRVQRVRLHIARQLERLDQLDSALQVYQLCDRHPARERQARIHAQQEEVQTALDICRQILTSPVSEEEALFAASFGLRLARKHQREWPEAPKALPMPEAQLKIPPCVEPVEIAACQAMQDSGACYYVENSLFCSIFGLVYWEVIFQQVRGAFTHPFQTGPHDLYDQDFLEKRKETLEQVNQQLANSEKLHQLVSQRFNEKQGITSPFVHWEILQQPLLNLALERIPVPHWRAVFDRLWADLRANRSGFPDLVYFPESGGYQLLEVKGPGDRLQKNQSRWMHYFSAQDIPHAVLHVQWN